MTSTPGALALLLLALAPVLPAAPLDGPPSARRLWDLSPFSWVRRARAEKGAPPSSHPLQVEAAALAQALGSVHLVVLGATEPLLSPPEVAGLGKALAEALAVAGPGEDLEVLSTSKREAGLFSSSLGVTARVFVRDGRLNLIVQEARLEFLDQYFRDFQMPVFDYGSRTRPGKTALVARGAERVRPDWVVLPLPAPVAAAPAPVTAPPPVTAPAPKPAPAPAAQAPEQPVRTLEQRLQDLKRLREKDLITEEDYRKRKEEILKEV